MPDNFTFGFRVLKGVGARLVRDGTLSGKVDGSVNVKVKEGVSGWRRGLLFERTYAYQQVDGHLYRLVVTRLRGLDILAVAYGRTNDEVWDAAYEQLRVKGELPDEEPEDEDELEEDCRASADALERVGLGPGGRPWGARRP